MASSEKEPIKETILDPVPTQPKAEPKPETKKQEKVQGIKPIYPKYAGYSCPVCGSKRLTDDAGKYICPVTPKPSDCPIK
jgi:hypothetical protein